MNLLRISLIAVLFFSHTSLIGQSSDDENNWYKETNRGDNWYSKFDFRRYSKTDVAIAKTKFLAIIGRQDLDEWEGTYDQPTMLGSAELTWSRREGYVEAYTYHTLAALDYGRCSTNDEKIGFLSEKPTRTRAKLARQKLIKVKFGESHFLIPEEYLRNFAERAAGLTTRSDENEYYWIKETDENKKVFGSPIYPKQFRHLIRQPIRMKIVSIAKPTIRQDRFDSGEIYARYHNRLVTFDKGASNGVKVGMSFFADDLDEWVQITRVGKKRSVGILSRSLNETNQEVCWAEESSREKERPCIPLRPQVYARTLSQEFKF